MTSSMCLSPHLRHDNPPPADNAPYLLGSSREEFGPGFECENLFSDYGCLSLEPTPSSGEAFIEFEQLPRLDDAKIKGGFFHSSSIARDGGGSK
jgi:hypothetical protein